MRIAMLPRLGALGLAFSLFVSIADAEQLPARLSDETFWHLVNDFSEPGGIFRSDNFISNEALFQHVIGRLKESAGTDGAYLGVGPDQNFTYIVALKPQIAFIVDIRRQNMLEHLMYKAIIELAPDRAAFLARLFSRKRPPDLDADSTAEDLFAAFKEVAADRDTFYETFAEIKAQLEEHHHFSLTPEDESNIQYILRAFYVGGPNLTYLGPITSSRSNSNRMPSYADLMMQTNAEGENLSYLSTESNFRILQDLERKNLIVPIVGDFAGPKALRAVGGYLKEHDSVVTAFYLSNVEQYLFQQDTDWNRFYENVSMLPVRSNSVFIRSVFNSYAIPYNYRPGYLRSASLLSPIQVLLEAFGNGKIETYYDVIRMSR